MLSIVLACIMAISRIYTIYHVFCMHSGNIRLMKCFCGMAWIHVFSVVCKHLGNIRLTSCFCGIARLDALYCVLHDLGQHQTNVLLPWDRPKSCFPLCCTCVKAISDYSKVHIRRNKAKRRVGCVSVRSLHAGWGV